MADKYTNLIAFVEDELAHGRSVVFGDNEHMSSLPRQIIGHPDLLAAITRNNGTLIMEVRRL